MFDDTLNYIIGIGLQWTGGSITTATGKKGLDGLELELPHLTSQVLETRGRLCGITKTGL